MNKLVYNNLNQIKKYILLRDNLNYAPEVLWTMTNRTFEQLPPYIQKIIESN